MFVNNKNSAKKLYRKFQKEKSNDECHYSPVQSSTTDLKAVDSRDPNTPGATPTDIHDPDYISHKSVESYS